MQKIRSLISLALVLLIAGIAGSDENRNQTRSHSTPSLNQASTIAPKPIPRKDAFFGLHFDLHPSKTDTALSADITEAMIAHLLDRIKPDYVQYDCKGHAGYTGYPSKVGWPSPGIKKDGLAIWRKATREHGVGLYIHYSGVWDSKAIEEHPEWARIDAQGKKDVNATSVFGRYVDELLIPQLKEVTSAYQLDGLWVDGECWAAQWDYSPAALAAWQKETGHTSAPKDRTEPNWLEWKMFNRRSFENYLCHWVDDLHAFAPGLQITSNWMYTLLAPKPVVAKLDFLSGDYSPSLSVDRARVDARYLASTGMPWDLMAWGFDKGKELGWSIKTAEHLQQEAAVVLMQGGGFQIYHTPTRAGYISESIIEQEGKVADFCRARQAVSHKSTSIPQVALLLSNETVWEESDRVYSAGGKYLDQLEGALHALLESHYSVDVLAEFQLQPRLKEFPLVVIPDFYKLTDEFKQAITGYVEQGGKLLLLGEKCARLFELMLGVRLEGESQNVTAELATSSGPVNVNGVWQEVSLTSAKATGFRYPDRNMQKNGQIAATISVFGKGQVAAVYGPLPLIYFRCHHPYLRRFVSDLAQQLFPDPIVRIDGPSYIDIALRRTKDGLTSLHLLNRANMPIPDRYGFVEDIPKVGPIAIKMRLALRPKKVAWEPDGTELKWSWKNGLLATTVPSLHIHGVVLLQ